MKKTMKLGTIAMALIAALCLTVSGVWAETSTVSGAFIFDKTTVSAGDYVNLSILGLDKNGAVDVYGEQFGATIFATVSSTLGSVTTGGASASTPASGEFKTDVKYVSLSQGKGKACISYGSKVSGNDSVNVTLQERYQAEGGGYVYKTISTYTQTVVVKPKSATVGWIAVTLLPGAAEKSNYNIDYTGTLEAGKKGEQFKIVAYTALGSTTTDTAADGNVTLTLRPTGVAYKQNNPTDSYVLTGTMTEGVCYITTDGTLQKAGEYYVEASFSGKTSVGPLHKDLLRIDPKTTANKFELTSSSTTFWTGTSTSISSWVGNNITVKVFLNDEYGNRMTLSSGTVNFKVTDSKSVIADQTSLSFDNTKDKVEITIDKNEIQSGAQDKDGTANLVASQTDSVKTVENSGVLELAGKKNGLYAVATGNLMTAGQNAVVLKEVSYASNGNTTTFASGTGVTVKYVAATGYDSGDTSINSDDTVTAKFTKKLSGGYLEISKDGYAPAFITTSNDIAPNDADKVTLLNAHGQSLTALPVYGNQTTVFSNRVVVQDAYGNNVTPTKYVYKVSSSKSGVSYSPGQTGTVNSGDTNEAVTVTYDPAKFSGTDDSFQIAILSAPGVSALKPTVEVSGTASLGSIEMSISTTTLPLNGEAPLCVETLTSSGSRVSADIFMSLTGDVTPTVTINGGGTLVNGSKLASTGRTILIIGVPNKTGNFTIGFKNADGTIASEKQFTVQSTAQQTKTVGDQPGEQKADVSTSENLNLVVNTTNTYGDVPKYQWFVFTATASGTQLPLYLLSDNGIFEIIPGLDIYQYTYSYPAGSTVQIAQLKMSDLGLKAGDTFRYAYAYQTADGKFVMDNVVILTVK